ncbi:MAG: imelysin family protein [Candidatus Competibacteraceae bacterium]|nr:imelysin family protein [Candidatus Competibacteraceae bacterium]
MSKTIAGLAVCLLATTAVAEPSFDKRAILATYADIAHAAYEDSLITAQALERAVATLIEEPSEANLQAARQAWRTARVPYQQTEVYRFGNPVVDEWEGKVNAWPLDEGLIDYVAGDYGQSADNPAYGANVIANPILKMGSETVDATTIDKALLAETLHELGGVEANVATGYHAIEFLLWGQDLNGTGPGAGQRPASDFNPANCTGGNCERRIQYLTTALELLLDDLAWMTGQWAPGGETRIALIEGDPDAGLTAMLTGMGSLSYGELAGERMKLGLMLQDPEEEHDCFSDNTHYSHYYDVVGIINVYSGSYTRVDGSKLAGPSLSDLVAQRDAGVNQRMFDKLQTTEAAMQQLVQRAEAGEAYDQMIGPVNPQGNAVVQKAIDTLTEQTRAIEQVVSVLALEPIAFEGSDSLDDPEAVFQ